VAVFRFYVAFRLEENTRFIWKFRLEAPPSLTMGTLAPIFNEHTNENHFTLHY
jgi:hypothetical protein